MPRRREVPKREILPDPKFGNVELSKFMNVIMEGGKKAIAERIIYGALEQIEKKNPGKDPLEAFVMAINNVNSVVALPGEFLSLQSRTDVLAPMTIVAASMSLSQ